MNGKQSWISNCLQWIDPNAVRTIPFSILIGIFVLRFFDLFTGVSKYDCGLAVIGANRVIAGELPHRDFFSLYPPGNFFLIAGLFQCFGKSLTLIYCLLPIVTLIILILIYRITLTISDHRAAFSSSIFFLICSKLQVGQPLPIALTFLLTGLLCSIRYFQTGRVWFLIVGGTLSGICCYFRHDFGFYSILVNTFVLICFQQQSKSNGLSRRYRQISYYLGPIVVLTIPFAWWLFFDSSADRYWNNLIAFPLTIYSQVRNIPYPMPWIYWKEELTVFQTCKRLLHGTVNFAAFWIVPLMLIYQLIITIRNWSSSITASNERNLPVYLLITATGICLWNLARVRSDWEHLTPSFTIVIILVSAHLFNTKSESLDRSVSSFGKFISIGLFAVCLVYPLREDFPQRWQTFQTSTVSLPGSDWITINDQEYIDSINWLREHTKPDERILVTSISHSDIQSNDALLYFLCDRLPATYYHELHPGLIDTKPVQEEIIEELDRQQIAFVVLTEEYFKNKDLTTEQKSDLIDQNPLDEYLFQQYDLQVRFGKIQILKRKNKK